MKNLKHYGSVRSKKMANRAEHCRECKEKMGKEFDEVHKWLDGLASPKKGYLDMNHRRWRHHDEGVEEIRLMYGDEAAKAAEMHIITDFGRIPSRREVESEFKAEPDLVSFKSLFG